MDVSLKVGAEISVNGLRTNPNYENNRYIFIRWRIEMHFRGKKQSYLEEIPLDFFSVGQRDLLRRGRPGA